MDPKTKLRILVGEKTNNKKPNCTLFLKIIENLVTKDQRTILSITATSFPNLMENIVRSSEKITELKIPKSTQIYNGWKDSQSGKYNKKVDRVNPLSREEIIEVKNLLKNYYFYQNT